MAIQVLSWHAPKPGERLPEPVIKDDSDQFPEDVVRQVREWLASVTPQLLAQHKPTDQIIQLSAPPPLQDVVATEAKRLALAPRFVGVPDTRVREATFQHGTAEIILRDLKTKLPLAKFHYAVGRTPDGLMILGPRLWIDLEGKVQ